MENSFLLLLLGWCITTIIVNGSIFKSFRNYLVVKYTFFGQLVSCVMCLGLWVGVITSWTFLSLGWISPIFPDSPFFISYLAFPFLQSGVCILIESLIIYFVKGANSRI